MKKYYYIVLILLLCIGRLVVLTRSNRVTQKISFPDSKNISRVIIISHYKKWRLVNDTIYDIKSQNEIKSFCGLFHAYEHNPNSDTVKREIDNVDGEILLLSDTNLLKKIDYNYGHGYRFQEGSDTVIELFTKRLEEFIGSTEYFYKKRIRH